MLMKWICVFGIIRFLQWICVFRALLLMDQTVPNLKFSFSVISPLKSVKSEQTLFFQPLQQTSGGISVVRISKGLVVSSRIKKIVSAVLNGSATLPLDRLMAGFDPRKKLMTPLQVVQDLLKSLG